MQFQLSHVRSQSGKCLSMPLVALLVVEGEMAHVEGVAEEVTAGTARNRRPLV